MYKRPSPRPPSTSLTCCTGKPHNLFPEIPAASFIKTPWTPSYFYETQCAYMNASDASAHRQRCLDYIAAIPVPPTIRDPQKIDHEMIRSFYQKFLPGLAPLFMLSKILAKAGVPSHVIKRNERNRNRVRVKVTPDAPISEPKRVIKVVKKNR